MLSASVHKSRQGADCGSFGFFVGCLADIGVYGVTSRCGSGKNARKCDSDGARGRVRCVPHVARRNDSSVCIGISIGFGLVVPASATDSLNTLGGQPTDPLSLGFAIGLNVFYTGIAAFLPARARLKSAMAPFGSNNARRRRCRVVQLAKTGRFIIAPSEALLDPGGDET